MKNSRSSNYHFDEAIKTYFMTIDSCLYTQGPRPGIIFLFDMKNVGLMHLTRINMSSVRKFFHYLQDGLPAKLKAIHVMNVVSFFDKILYIIKPFIHAEILNVVSGRPTCGLFNQSSCALYSCYFRTAFSSTCTLLAPIWIRSTRSGYRRVGCRPILAEI